VSYFKETLRRIGYAWGWTAAQFWATLLIVLAGVGWTRVPEKHVWQVGLTLLLPLVIVAATLTLEAGTMRRFFHQEERRARFAVGALTLLVWIAVVWLAWTLLDWCDDQSYQWASYLNSRLPAGARARVFTYEHIETSISVLVWIFRWIVVPAKVIPHALASAEWGWRLPWRKLFRMLLNWRWWLGVVIAALVGALLPSYFYHGEPQGTVAHQVWAVVLKLAGAYLLAVLSWALLLAWGAVLLARQAEPAKDALDQQLLTRLWAGRWWMAGLAVWALLFNLSDSWMNHLGESNRSSNLVSMPAQLALVVVLLILTAGLLRAMIGPSEKRVRIIWGTLMMFAWALLGLAATILLGIYHAPAALLALCWVLIPGVLLPFAAPSAEWGACLPWRKVLNVLSNWRWWLGAAAMLIIGVALPAVLLPAATEDSNVGQGELFLLRKILACVLALGSWVMSLGWYVALLARGGRRAQEPDDAMRLLPVGSGPLGEDSEKLPLPESGNDAQGNI